MYGAGPSQQPYAVGMATGPATSATFSMPSSSSQPVYVQSPAETEIQSSPAMRSSQIPQQPGQAGRGHTLQPREHEALLLSFIYDYFYKNGLRSVAAALLREAPGIQVRPVDTKRPAWDSSSASKQASSPILPPHRGPGGHIETEDDSTEISQGDVSAKAMEAGSVATSVDSIFDKRGSRTSTSPPSSTSSPPTNTAMLPEPGVPIDVERGFLTEWWAMFWDVYRASSGKSASRNAQVYVEDDRQLRAQQMAMRNQPVMSANASRPIGALNNNNAAPGPNQSSNATVSAMRLAQQHPAQLPQPSQPSQLRLANGQVVAIPTTQGRAIAQRQAAEEHEYARIIRTQQEQHAMQAAQYAQAAHLQSQPQRSLTPGPGTAAKRVLLRQPGAGSQPLVQGAVNAMPRYPQASPAPDQAILAAHQANALEAQRQYRAGVVAQQQRQMSSHGVGHAGGHPSQLPSNLTQAQIQSYLYAQPPQQMQPAPLTPRSEHPPPIPPSSGHPSAAAAEPTNHVSSPGPMYTSAPTPKNPPPSGPRSAKRTGGSEAVNEPPTKRRTAPNGNTSPPRLRQLSAAAGREGKISVQHGGLPHQAAQSMEGGGSNEDFNHFDFAALLGGPVHAEAKVSEHHGDASLFDIDQYLDFGTTV